jgi:lipopolysaccharide export LptBFGC system permease protein LptF
VPSKNITKSLIGVIFCGVVMSLVTGLIENPPQYSIIGAKHYGFPLVWRVTMVTMPEYIQYTFVNLALDAFFWVVVSLVALMLLMRLSNRSAGESLGTSSLSEKI